MQSRSGELAMRPLPAVLLDLHEGFATGKLVLRRGRVAKTVDLVNGNPVSTASTPRDETLGHFLVTSGVITEIQHRQAVERASLVGGKLGEALVALQILTVEQLIEQLGRQARHKIVQALRWPQGAWRFEDGAQAVEGMQLRMVEIVLTGLRETAASDLGRLVRLDNLSFELTERGRHLAHELRRAFGERTMAVLTAGAPLAEIEKAAGDRAAARIAVDAMLMCDAIVPKNAPVGLGAGDTIQGVAAVPATPPPLPTRTRTRDRARDELYEVLFEGEEDAAPLPVDDSGSLPLVFEELDTEVSGMVSTSEVDEVLARREQASAARQAIAAEHQRIGGADHYAVLLVERDAEPDDIAAAYDVKLAMLDRSTAGVADPSDRAKLDEIHAAYQEAHAVLTDERRRAAYDRELAGGELVQVPPAIDTELDFRRAESFMARGQWDQALGVLKTVLARSPGEADYHAAVGWATWHDGGAGPEAADAARAHLNHALSIHPDHAASHDYKGRIDAALRVDDAGALFHLERALDLDPTRLDALATLESLLASRGDLRRIERVLKRLLFRLRERGGAPEAAVWVRLATLYLDQLDDRRGAEAAIASARKLAPRDPVILALAERTAKRREVLEPLRAGWREALGDPQSGAQLVRTTEAAGHVDAAFLAASTMVALGTADEAMAAQYERSRVKTPVIPQAALTREQWSLLRHPADSVEIGGLFELLAPAIQALAPMTLADSELEPDLELAGDRLPATFRALRDRLAVVLGVKPAPVFPRAELGKQIHVIACDPPVLVAGDDALTAPERPELVFRLARAMTFLWPGRAVGASRPGRVLRAVVRAALRDAAGTELGPDDPLAAAGERALAGLRPATRAQVRAAALRLLSVLGGGLNLSLWARSLSRTADRVGLVLCGDAPAAFAGAREAGELDKDLVEFTFSAAHVRLRAELGLVHG